MWQRFFNRNGRSWQVKMAERTRVFTPAARVLSMVATRSGEEFAAIEEELSRKGVIVIRGGRVAVPGGVEALVGVLENYGGAERYCGRIPQEAAPWKVVKTFSGPQTGSGPLREDV